jgi:lactoylglutathione lyase
MIRKLFETHINVLNLDRSMAFYENILNLKLGTLDQKRRVAFYWIGGQNVSMLGLWEQLSGGFGSQHFAFEVSQEDLEQWIKRLVDNQIEIHNFLNTDDKRPLVFGWMPAVSIYFPDPDGHELEIIATLPGRARPEVGIVSWTDWKSMIKSDP